MAAVLDEVGGLPDPESFRADPAGYVELMAWFEGFGQVTKVGVEGTGSDGNRRRPAPGRGWNPRRRSGPPESPWPATGRQVRPRRRRGRPGGLSGRAHGTARAGTDKSQAIRVLVVAKRSARGTDQGAHPVRQLTFSAPAPASGPPQGPPHRPVRRRRSGPGVPRVRPTWRPRPPTCRARSPTPVAELEAKIADLDAMITPLLGEGRSRTAASMALGSTRRRTPLVAAAGDNPGRLHSQAAWAHLCLGLTAQASSGQSATRPLGDRGGGTARPTRALWHIVITRLASGPRDPGPHGSAGSKPVVRSAKPSACSSATSPARSHRSLAFSLRSPDHGPGSPNACRRWRLTSSRYAGPRSGLTASRERRVT